MDYYRKISKIVAVEGGIVATTFIVAFILVVIFYVKTFMQIRRTAEAYGKLPALNLQSKHVTYYQAALYTWLWDTTVVFCIAQR